MYTKTLLYVVEFKAPPKTQTSKDMFRKWGSAFSGFPGRRASAHDLKGILIGISRYRNLDFGTKVD